MSRKLVVKSGITDQGAKGIYCHGRCTVPLCKEVTYNASTTGNRRTASQATYIALAGAWWGAELETH